MADLFLILFFVSFSCLIAGLVSPSIFTPVFKKKVTRKKIALIFGVALLVFFILTGVTNKPKESVKQPIKPEETIETTEEEIQISEVEPTPTTIVSTPTTLPTPTTTVSTPTTLSTPTTTVASTPTVKTNRSKMIEIFKAEALAEWGNDYVMVEYEIKQQTEAYDWVVKYSKYTNILNKAKQEWGNDYVMVKYEYQQQSDAYEWINKQTAYPEIMTGAKQEWGDDYVMVKYEYEQQVEAYEAL